MVDGPDHHTQWVQACSAIGWATDSELRAAGKAVPANLKGLPYCDVHDGIDYRRKDVCTTQIGPKMKDRPTSADSPDGKCRVAPDLADWKQFEIKVRTLKETFQYMDKDGLTLVALQEVFNEDAVRQILPAGWDVKTSASLANAPKIPQHVGVAWKTTAHQLDGFEPLNGLSDVGSRSLRPGLLFRTTVLGKPTDFLVVHLKAGCRSVQLNQPRKSGEIEACPLMAEQTQIIERWIDARVGRDFVVLGDFNRSLLKELEQFPEPNPAQFGANALADTAWVAPEWNDNLPAGSKVLVLPHLRKPDGNLIAGDFYCAQTTGIDHIVLSDSLAKRATTPSQLLELLPVSYRLNGKRLPIGKTVVPPSDHCARYLKLQ